MLGLVSGVLIGLGVGLVLGSLFGFYQGLKCVDMLWAFNKHTNTSAGPGELPATQPPPLEKQP